MKKRNSDWLSILLLRHWFQISMRKLLRP
jgi:hypothetical protein